MAAKILDPIRINNLTIENRVVYTAHGTFLSIDSFSESHIAYMTARARGGCGLAIVECTSVHPTSVNTLNNFDDSVIPGFRKMMASIRPHGMKMFQQLYHGGHNAYQPGKRPPLAPSLMPGTETKGMPIPLSEEEIEIIIEAFGAAAARCREGGLDGVEIHGAHGYLIHQFLNPAVNRREDRWGGDLENRMRFLLEILRRVRSRVGRDYAVGVRLSTSEAFGGLSETDLKQVIRALIDEDLIDYLNASYGDYYDPPHMVGPMSEPMGYMLPSSRQLTEGVTTIPRLVTGRFRTLDEAQQVLNEGIADMIGMVRAQIADPNLVRKTREGRETEVRPCIACNQGCVGGLFRDTWLGCAVNPSVGFEKYLAEEDIERSDRPRRILVVGGGPAGMEAARIAALQGHQVTLAEASARLGGAINAAKRAPKLHMIGDIIDWQERELFRLGVEVRLSTYMEAQDVLDEGADRIIIATGSLPRMDGMQATRPLEPALGVELPHVFSSLELLLGTKPVSGTQAVVLDDTGHYEAIAVADELFSKGFSVTWVTRFQSFAPHMQFNFRGEASLQRLYRNERKFNLLVNHHLAEIRTGEVTVHPVPAPERPEIFPADVVVLVTPNEPLRSLHDALRHLHPDVQLVGDALAPRDIQYAIADGHRAMRPPAPVVGDRSAAPA